MNDQSTPIQQMISWCDNLGNQSDHVMKLIRTQLSKMILVETDFALSVFEKGALSMDKNTELVNSQDGVEKLVDTVAVFNDFAAYYKKFESPITPQAVANFISNKDDDTCCVCSLSNQDGQINHKILSKCLADKWECNILFTGTRSEAYKWMSENKPVQIAL